MRQVALSRDRSPARQLDWTRRAAPGYRSAIGRHQPPLLVSTSTPLMDWLYSLKLIRLFDFYLALAFLLSTVVRIRQYQTILRVVRAVPSRWPRLFALVRQYRHLFLTWGTILPLAATLARWVGHTLFRRTVLSATDDDLTLGRLLQLWAAWPFVLVSGVAMLGFDLYGAFNVAVIEQEELEKYFDQAEYWLRSWT